MHRYFLIPILSFFGFICLFVIYLQFINENWKFLVPKKDLPLICDDDSFVKLYKIYKPATIKPKLLNVFTGSLKGPSLTLSHHLEASPIKPIASVD